jgi:predicted homoserine dehydrogenase-like protein
MILIDRALQQREEENKPIRVGMIGAGFMGRMIAFQIGTSVTGMRMVAIANRHVEKAKEAYALAGIHDVQEVSELDELEDAILKGRCAVTENPLLLSRAENIDVLIEVTGTINYAVYPILEAIQHNKHVILMNAELDATLGPILKTFADKKRVVYTNADGDQPGVEMNLYRFVKGTGIRPVLAGNVKGLYDPHRTPETQAAFAKQWGQNPRMVTSFADGTKVSFEQAVVANATGMSIAKRGMLGFTVPSGMEIREAFKIYPADVLLKGNGIVDYLVAAEPGAGVFIIGHETHPLQRKYLELYKLGKGPFYCFYAPYHLCHFEIPNSVARTVIFHDAAATPMGAPQVDVVATAKRDLRKGEMLDGIGCFMTYGQCEKAEITYSEQLLPMGIAEGCVLNRDITKDAVLTYRDVTLPENSMSVELRRQQDQSFFSGQKDMETASLKERSRHSEEERYWEVYHFGAGNRDSQVMP